MRGRQPDGTKTKVLETGGRSVRGGLVKSNQFPRQSCDREDCQLCNQQGEDIRSIVCDKENVGYQGECTRCPVGSFAYIGETSRTAYTRVGQHLAAYRAASAAKLPAQPQHVAAASDTQPRAPKSWMWKHTQEKHQGNVGPQGGEEDYNFKVEGAFQKCLYRQVDEDVRMKVYEEKGGEPLNSKYEYYMPKSEDVRMKLYEEKGGELLNSKYEYYMPKSVQPEFRQQ